MPLPLLWLGAAASVLAVKALGDDRKLQQRIRYNNFQAKTLADLKEHESPIAIYPTDMFYTQQGVIPIDLMNRSIVNEDKFSVARRLIEQ